ncbi:haloacid dehalogenase-like hydrolase [Halospeciosus flavus]|uniref:Haloacid dehalogenase-like hydrolase n=1 Tax=Halospeciosus flavus TaxID=3032283 RepID=A0ABD5Z8J3_9EURY|nr:haloacid dehalogenase-like hydrolase [Halospeciosus flavus]
MDGRIGLCLDVDGTVYREGSVFVETMGYVQFSPLLDVAGDDRRALREALGAVATFRGGERARQTFSLAFRLLDAVQSVFGDGAAARALRWFVRAQHARTGSTDAESTDYREMQRTVLDAYGRFLRRRRPERVHAAAERVAEKWLPVDERFVSRFDDDGTVEPFLVTDVPEHVAAAYAARLTGEPDWTAATTCSVADGRFTGDYSVVEKRAAVERLRETRSWEYVVAAGDSPVDREMADAADVFLGVEGVSGDGPFTDDAEALALPADPVHVEAAMDANRPLVVPHDVPLVDALDAVLDRLDSW